MTATTDEALCQWLRQIRSPWTGEAADRIETLARELAAARLRADMAEGAADAFRLSRRAEGAREERARVVAWLRSDDAQIVACTHPCYMVDLADAIEANTHNSDASGRGDDVGGV